MKPNSRPGPISPLLRTGLVFFILVVSSFCYVLVVAGLEYASPLAFAGLRALVAGVFLLLLTRISGRPLGLTRVYRAWIVPLALLATTLTYGSMLWSPALTGAGLSAVLGNLRPLGIILLAAFFLHERITPDKLAALLLGGIGAVLIAASTGAATTQAPLSGAALAVVTSLSSAAGSVLVKKLSPGRHLLALCSWQLLLGSVLLLILSFLVESDPVEWSRPFVANLLFLALAETALVTLIWFWLLERSDAGALSVNLFLVPVVGMIWAYLLRGEVFTFLQLAGTGLVVVGLAFTFLFRSPEPPAERLEELGGGIHRGRPDSE